MVHYKYSYFDARSPGETPRLILHYANIPFEDDRFTEEEFPALKHTFPFGKVPVLYVDGKPLPESNAINRYLARKYGLAGKDEWEEAQLDAIADFHKDVYAELAKYLYPKMGWEKGDLAELYPPFVESTEKLFAIYVKLLKESGSGFIAKSGVSWVDFLIADYLLTIRIQEPETLKKFPELEAYIDKIHALPQIKDYVEKRPFAKF